MGKKEEIVLFVDEWELESDSKIPFCRICHEAEFESCKSLETPCSCSGTVKFAHRDCIQRWCDEKGNTSCEICLQNFEPGYTAPIKKAKLLDAAVTIRGSLEVPRRGRELENPELNEEEQVLENEFDSDADKRAVYFRIVALIFTLLLLVRHLVTVLVTGTEDYPFTLLTLLIAKTSGIVIPMYILIRIGISIQQSFQNGIRNRYQDPEDGASSSESEEEDEEEDEEQRHFHRVDIQS